MSKELSQYFFRSGGGGSSSGGTGVNFILNPDAESDTGGWSTYALTESVTFTDAGDLVTLSAHGLSTGSALSFSVITTTTGISVNTTYYAIVASSSTFQVASSLANAQAGTALALTTNGTGTVLKSFPMTGTGGSPTVTWTRSTSTPLTGTGSFLFTKDAANRMGEGSSYAFSCDNASQAKVLTIECDYIVGSGTFVAGSSGIESDVEVWIYDVTNAVMIQPSTYKFFSNSSTTSGHFSATFQTASNSTSYRLILHTATTSASAYTLKFDTVQVAPSKYIYGTPITDWKAYTPTFSAGFGTVTGVSVLSRRVGSNLEVTGTVTAGTVVASAATMTIGYNGANANVTMDTAIIGAAYPVGQWGTTNSNYTSGAVVYNSTTTVGFGQPVLTTAGAANAAVRLQTTNVTVMGGNGNTTQFIFSVPIVGWSSSVQMSDNADTRVVAFSGSSTTSVTSATVNLVFTTIYDTHGAFNTSTFTAPVQGYYRIGGHLRFGSVAWTLGDAIEAYYSKNGGATVIIARNNMPTYTGQAGLNPSATVLLNAGDTLLFKAYSARTVAIESNGTNAGGLTIERVSGPSAIAATEFIGAKYNNSAGTSIANTGDNTVPFATKSYDTHGAFVTDTFTAPAAGRYRVSAVVVYASSTYAVGNQIILAVYKNGSIESYGGPIEIMAIVTQVAGSGVTTTVSCVAGDLITIRAQNTRTAGATLLNTAAGLNHVEIERVG